MENIVSYRREFHKYPEIGWKEIRTSARIAELLESFGYKDILMGEQVIEMSAVAPSVKLTQEQKECEMERGIVQGGNEYYVHKTEGVPGVIVEFDTKVEGPITAFRFDMDCLPYGESLDKDFRPNRENFCSVNPKSVHACGHDGHIAIGLAIAEELMKGKYIQKGKVRLIFQPAEESFSGAESIVEKGHLDDVNYFVALHLALSADGRPLPSNTICCGCKDFLSDRQVDVHYEGKSAHPCGASQEGKNALLAACSAALNLHSIAPHESGLFRINVGEIHAGVCANTIAPNALLRLEYRGENKEIVDYGKRRVEAIIKSAADMYELDYDIVDYGEVPAGKSDDAMMRLVEKAAKKVDWFKKIYFEGNVGGTDDASVMINRVQENGGIGTYIGIGTDTTDVVHNAKFDFDEDCLNASMMMCLELLEDIHK